MTLPTQPHIKIPNPLALPQTRNTYPQHHHDHEQTNNQQLTNSNDPTANAPINEENNNQDDTLVYIPLETPKATDDTQKDTTCFSNIHDVDKKEEEDNDNNDSVTKQPPPTITPTTHQ